MSPFGNYRRRQRKTPVFVSVLTICVTLAIRWYTPGNVYTRHLNAGYSYYNRHEYGTVISECTAALIARPNSYRALLLRGSAYDKLNLDQKAIADETAAIPSAIAAPDFGAVYYNRGLSYERIGKTAQAISDFTECLRNTPGNYGALLERADCYRISGNSAETINDVNTYLKHWKPTYYAYYMRGQAFVQQKKWKESAADFDRELQLNPDDAIGWGSLGWSQYMCGELANAIESDRTTLARRPNLTFARYNLALCFAVQNNWGKAKPEYEKAIKSGAKPADIKSALEDIHDALRKAPGSSALANAEHLVASAQHTL